MGTLQTPTDERAILETFLDWDRAVVANKARGLDRAGATHISTPTGLTVLSIVVHLTVVEARWFQLHLAGREDVPPSESSWTVAPDLTVEAAVAAYEETGATSRAIAADLGLDAVGLVPQKHLGLVTLRYVLVHMIEETARHLGHLDVLREMTDGQVGDG